MINKKRLIAYDPITFESFTRHATNHREPNYYPYDEGYVDAVDQIEGWLDVNTVDAVEVVLCKYCKYWLDGYCDNPKGLDFSATETAFCSYGERKDSG